MSPDPTTEDFLSPLSRATHDNDRSDKGGHSAPSQALPPNSHTGQALKLGHYALALSARRRTTLRAPSVNRTNTVSTQSLSVAHGTRFQRFKASLANLVTPGHKLGESPGFVRELKSILFGTCSPTIISVSRYMWS